MPGPLKKRPVLLITQGTHSHTHRTAISKPPPNERHLALLKQLSYRACLPPQVLIKERKVSKQQPHRCTPVIGRRRGRSGPACAPGIAGLTVSLPSPSPPAAPHLV